MTRLSLVDIRELAADVAREEDPALQVLAASNAEGAADYSEVTVTLQGCASEHCRVVIGVRRDANRTQIRDTLREQLREHLRSHR